MGWIRALASSAGGQTMVWSTVGRRLGQSHRGERTSNDTSFLCRKNPPREIRASGIPELGPSGENKKPEWPSSLPIIRSSGICCRRGLEKGNRYFVSNGYKAERWEKIRRSLEHFLGKFTESGEISRLLTENFSWKKNLRGVFGDVKNYVKNLQRNAYTASMETEAN